MARVRMVNPMSLMADVFVLLERLHVSLEQVRDELVVDPDELPMALFEARRHGRRIDEELRRIKSLLPLRKAGQKSEPTPTPPESEPTPPVGPPDLKLVG